MNAKDYLQDIAGVRVICYFVDDIYNLTELLKSQSDLIVIRNVIISEIRNQTDTEAIM